MCQLQIVYPMLFCVTQNDVAKIYEYVYIYIYYVTNDTHNAKVRMQIAM